MKAIPLSIQFIQYYIEEYQFTGHPAHNTSEYKHEFRYENLYQVFVDYQQRIGVTKPIPLNTFRDCISNDSNLKYIVEIEKGVIRSPSLLVIVQSMCCLC